MKVIVDSSINSINVLGPLLLLTSLYKEASNAMIRNKLLKQNEKLILIETGELRMCYQDKTIKV